MKYWGDEKLIRQNITNCDKRINKLTGRANNTGRFPPTMKAQAVGDDEILVGISNWPR